MRETEFVIDIDTAKDFTEEQILALTYPKYVYWGDDKTKPIRVLPIEMYDNDGYIYKIGDRHNGLIITYFGVVEWPCPNVGQTVAYYETSTGYGVFRD